MTYRMTDDPSDPCAYCVMWEESDGDWEAAVPWRSPTEKADRIYRGVHDECEKAVMQYVAEASL